MSFTRVNPGGWGFNEKLTSAQMNQIDTNVSNAVDGRGGTYNNASTINITGQVALANITSAVASVLRRNLGSGVTGNVFPEWHRGYQVTYTWDCSAPITTIFADQITGSYANYYWTLSRVGAAGGNIAIVTRLSNTADTTLNILDSGSSIATIGDRGMCVFVYVDDSEAPFIGWKQIFHWADV